eukprot:1161049-Pelagomonas_calceolata.AAC.2
MSLPHQRARGKLVWVRWVSGSTWPQGIRITMRFFDFNGTSGRDSCWAWLSLVGRLTVLTLLVVEGLELQFLSYHLALFLVAGPVCFLCLPCFSQFGLCGGEVIRLAVKRLD